LGKVFGFFGVNHHGGHGGWARQQGNGQRHHGDAGPHGGFGFGIVHLIGVGAGFGGLGVEHRQGGR
jgi:hypothetical protein